MVRVNVGITKLLRAYVAIKSLLQVWPWGSNCSSKSYLLHLVNLVETVPGKKITQKCSKQVEPWKNNERSDLEDLNCHMMKPSKKNGFMSRIPRLPVKCISTGPSPPHLKRDHCNWKIVLQHFSANMLVSLGGSNWQLSKQGLYMHIIQRTLILGTHQQMQKKHIQYPTGH